MISAIITTLNDERRLGAAMACLVPAAMDAFVREVIVADAGSTDQTLEIAEDAGAKVVSGLDAFRGACARARQPWLLILPGCARLEAGWEAAVEAHVGGDGVVAAAIEPASARSWFKPWGGSPRAQGLLILRTACLAIADSDRTSPAALAAKARRGRRALRLLAAIEA